ncbi:MAG: hypothetical protein ACJ73C_02865 [Nitrososphaeraceae archaeon]
MPPLTDEQTRRNVIRQWISGFPRDTIASENNIGAGTVSSIVANYKLGLEELDFDSIRQLSVETRQHGLNLSELASHFRLHNYFIKSGASENTIESFITKVSSGDVSPEKAVQYVNQLYDVSKEESIPLDQVSNYIEKKLEEKKKIDDQIIQADTALRSKNVSIEAINEHIQLNEKLNEYGLSTHNIDELLNLVLNAKRYGFEPKKIVAKLRTIQRLEKKEKGLKNNCTILANLLDRHKETVPLAELIEAMHVGKNELISFKIAANEAAELYGFPRSTAAVYILNNLKDYNKKGQLKKELSSLHLQKYAVEEFCSKRSQVIMALMNLKSHGITEEQIISLNSVLESNGYKTSSYTSIK